MTVKRMTRKGPNETELTQTLSQDDRQGMFRQPERYGEGIPSSVIR
jgi:hypothetical protein